MTKNEYTKVEHIRLELRKLYKLDYRYKWTFISVLKNIEMDLEEKYKGTTFISKTGYKKIINTYTITIDESYFSTVLGAEYRHLEGSIID